MRRLGLLFLSSIVVTGMYAKDFFSKEDPDETITIGVHVGVNTSNRTVSKNVFDEWNCNSWGTGVDVGATVDVNFKDWFSIQPGFFFDTRSGNYAYSTTIVKSESELDYVTQFGHGRSYNFIIPVLAAVHFNLSDDVRWNVEAGPYLQIALSDSFNDKVLFPKANVAQSPVDLPSGWAGVKSKTCDFGFKFGTDMTVLKHYNIGVHYLAGCLNVWNNGNLGGRHKQWEFTIGYIF